MPTRSYLAAVVAVSLLLTGCAVPASVAKPTPTTPSDSSSPEPALPVLDSMFLSVDGVLLANDDDSIAGTAEYADGAGLVALLTDAFGAAPVTEETGDTWYPAIHHHWGDDAVIVSIRGPYADGTFGDAWIRITVPEYAGLAIYTDGGVMVGTDRKAVEVLAPYDTAYDGDGDGASDALGLIPTPVPGTESLSRPGEVGTAFVEVFFAGDTVTWLRSPSNDYSDV
jgi:hypothetical protein